MLIANVQISFGEIKQLECYVLIGKMWIFKREQDSDTCQKQGQTTTNKLSFLLSIPCDIYII